MIAKGPFSPCDPAGRVWGIMRLLRVMRTGSAAPVRGALSALAALLFAAGPVLAAPAGEVAVVCDRSVAPYRELLERFSETCACRVRVIPPEEVRREGLEQRLKASGTRALLAVGLQARAAVEGVRELPVLLTMTPQAERWVAAQPNRFGIEMALPPRRQLEVLRRIFPRARRIGLVFDPAESGSYVREAQRAAAGLGLTLVAGEIARPGELAGQLEKLRGSAEVLWVLPDPTVLQAENFNLLLLASFESRTPLFGFARKYAELGAVAATHVEPAALGAQAAALLRRLESLPPAGAPRHEYAREARLVLNERVARKMGLVLGTEALEAADDVIR